MLAGVVWRDVTYLLVLDVSHGDPHVGGVYLTPGRQQVILVAFKPCHLWQREREDIRSSRGC